jgi:hypothetical protein
MDTGLVESQLAFRETFDVCAISLLREIRRSNCKLEAAEAIALIARAHCGLNPGSPQEDTQMSLPTPEVCQIVYALHQLLGQPQWREDDRKRLLQLLSENGLTWNDLPEILAAVNTSTGTSPPELLVRHGLSWADMPMVFAAINSTAEKTPRKFTVFQRLYRFFGTFGNVNEHEATAARKKLDALLLEHTLTWLDMTTILAASVSAPSLASTAAAESEMPEVNVLDLVLRLVEKYVVISAAERMAVALYVVFTYVVFKYFLIAPRLGVTSPVEVSGKSLLLILLDQLVFHPYSTDNITAPGIYHQLYFGGEQTMLLDEGDNLGLFEDKKLRAALNSGYRYSGKITRVIDGRPRAFRTFGPLVIAAIGKLPLPLLSRCVATIKMLRPTPDELQQVEKLDLRRPDIAAIFHATREQLEKFAATCILPLDPHMPSELRLRNYDNWQPLIAIADTLGRGQAARAAAIELCACAESDRPSGRAS